jgi:uncharacterized membrane protein HdeD (DUF308 family)
MSLFSQPDPYNPKYEECMRMHRSWPWFVVLGIILMVLGLVAISCTNITAMTTLAAMFVLGILLMVGAVVEVVNAFLARTWGGFFLHLLSGVLHFIVGELLIEHPVAAAEGLTLLLAVAFLVGGLMRILFTLFHRFAGSGWVLLNGCITFLLGLLIWREWPGSSEWVIGLFIGIDLIFSGWSWVMLGMLVKSAGPGSQPAQPGAPTSVPAGQG